MPFFVTNAITLSTGETVYATIEEIDDESIKYWRWYLDSAEYFSKKISTPFIDHSLDSVTSRHTF